MRLYLPCLPGPTSWALLTILAGIATPVNASMDFTPGDCETAAQLRVDNMPLSEVLAPLGETLNFELMNHSDTDPIINGEFVGSTLEILNKLTADMNVIRTTQTDPNCVDQVSLARLFLLPLGEETERIVAVPEGMQRYRRAHGMDPQTGELIKR
jgi:hypothetical protein